MREFLIIVAWALLSATIAVASEVYLRHVGRWSIWFLIGGIGISLTLYPVIIKAPSLIAGILVYSTATLVLRTLASQFILHEPIVRGQAVAVVGMALLVAVRFAWR